MSTQRYISTSFWDDAWVQTLDPSEKFLYLYFLTNPLANIAGVYEITLRRICFDTGYNSDTVSKVLDRFSKDRKAFFIGGFMIMPKAPKHQRWQSSQDTKKGIDRILAELPDEVKGALKGAGYAYPDIPKAPRRPPIGPHQGDVPTLLNSTLLNSTLPSEDSAAGAAPPESKSIAPAKAKKDPKERDPLRDALSDSFLAKVGEYASPAKENTNLVRLASAIRRKASAESLEPEACALGLLETYWRLHESGKPFWSAFTPSKMLSQFEDLWALWRKATAAADVSWVDDLAPKVSA